MLLLWLEGSLNFGPRTRTPGTETVKMLKTLRRNVQHLETLVAKVIQENSNLTTEIGVKVERREVN